MWYQLKIENCPAEEIEQISEELEEAGALSVTLTDKGDTPVLEPAPGETPFWDEVIIHSLYAQAEAAQASKIQLQQMRPQLQCSIEFVANKDWEQAWMDDFKPQRFGDRLWICPTWLTPPDPEAVNLMLDPGLAFGTGTHPTTSLCLTWLEQAQLSRQTLIDYGCGSGILSLAALKLGAHQVMAVDIDNQALQATLNNAHLNDLHELSVDKPEALEKPVNIIIANILLDPLISLKDRFHQLLKQEGILTVSGILTEQAPVLIDAYKSSFSHVTTEYLDGWSLIVFKRK